MTGDASDNDRRSTDGASEEFSTGLGAAAARGYPQGDGVHPQDGDVSRETATSDVPRETPTGWQVHTAADLAARDVVFDDQDTPLAQAAQHSVLARSGGLRRQGVPRPDGTRVLVVANQ